MVKELRDLTLEYNETLKLEVIPKLYKPELSSKRKSSFTAKLNEDSISFILKYNLLMSHSSIEEAADSDYVKGMASFGVTNFSQILLKDLTEGDRHLMSLSRKSLTALLQVPFTLMEQLLLTPLQHYDHETLMLETKLLHELLDFYLDLNRTFKKHAHDIGQLVSLQFLIEGLILASGSDK